MTGTIAILADDYIEYQKLLVNSIASEVKNCGYGALCIIGAEVDGCAQENQPGLLGGRIYPHVHGTVIDGLISLSGTIGNNVSVDKLSEFVTGYGVPAVSVGIELTGMPNVMVDDRTGMVNLVNHLIEDTTAQNFAFIQGLDHDPYSERREAIFRDILLESGIAINESLIVRGNYDPLLTYQVVLELLAEHGRVDAIVAANDAMALSAARAVTSKGYEIPTDVLITGFDDTGEASRHSPALTTVRQPLFEIAKKSVSMLIDQLHGSAASARDGFESVTVNTELIIRGSTACSQNSALSSADFVLSSEEIFDRIKGSMVGLSAPQDFDLMALSESIYKTITESYDYFSEYINECLLDDIRIDQQHWWSNLCYQIESCANNLAKVAVDKTFRSLVVAALATVREKLWALSMEREFDVITYNNWHALLHLEMSSCIKQEEILATTATWIGHVKPKGWCLVWNDEPQPTPHRKSSVAQRLVDGRLSTYQSLFETEQLLPAPFIRSLQSGLTVLSPICVGGLHYGYLLIDPDGIKSIDISAASRSIGNAMRSRYLRHKLELQARDLEWANYELEQLANHDALTGLPNRFHFEKKLQSAVASTDDNKRLAIIFVDLDGFKGVNDSIGHKGGDRLLQIIADRLKKVVGKFTESGFVARLGGDEFTVIIDDASFLEDNGLDALSTEMLRCASRPCTINDSTVAVSASIGYTISTPNRFDASALLSQADSAMYLAKSAGKNAVSAYTSELAEADKQRRHLETNLRKALTNGELTVHFQPRINLATGLICGAEALTRWVVETKDGPVTVARPDQFIPIAEQFGMINDLDAVALDQSLRQVAHWESQGIDITVSVNVSVMRLQKSSFVNDVLESVKRFGVDPTSIELEITESAAMEDVEENIEKMRALKAAGIRLAIDDFGTGYSSLNYLKKLPVDNLKIDRSFIMELDEQNSGDGAETAVVRSIVALGKSMEIGLVAEGIETDHQREFVTALNCEEGQGYFYYKPMPGTELTQILLSQIQRRAA